PTFSLILPPLTRSTLFPYTTLFRSNWAATSTTNAPSARYLHTAVWTGSEMIVWGGYRFYLNTGGRYCAQSGAPSPTPTPTATATDRKSTRLNSSHVSISYAVFCLKK